MTAVFSRHSHTLWELKGEPVRLYVLDHDSEYWRRACFFYEQATGEKLNQKKILALFTPQSLQSSWSWDAWDEREAMGELRKVERWMSANPRYAEFVL